MRLILETDSLLTLKYKKGNCAEFGPVNVFQFERGSVKPIPCIRIEVIKKNDDNNSIDARKLKNIYSVLYSLF